MAFAIKAEIPDPRVKAFTLVAQKTMYGGKHIAEATRFSCSLVRTRVDEALSRAALSVQPRRWQRSAGSPDKRRV
jgi:hypothetical protein